MIINCCVYQDGRKLADIDIGGIAAHRGIAGRFVWVALQDATEAEFETLQQVFGLHPLAVEDARQGRQRPKVEEYGDALFAVLHLLHLQPPERASGPPPRVRAAELAVFAGSDYVLSVRQSGPHDLRGVRARCERESELLRQGPGFVLYALMDEVVDGYFPIATQIEDELEAAEKQIFTQGAARQTIRRLYLLRRRLRVLRHAVAPLLDAVSRLHGPRVPRLCAATQDYFRDVGDHLSRLQGTIDATRETIASAMQVNLSLVTLEDSEVTKRLAAWAAIFAVCTAFVGVWGMNFDNMPELKWRWGYPAALALIGAVCGLLYWRFRRAGWL